MNAGQQFTGQAPSVDDRPIFTFPIPASLQSEKFKHASLGMRLLNVQEELTASSLGNFDVLRSQYEAAKLAIAEIDGQPANQANGDVDVFWEAGGPKMRSLMLQAYRRLSQPSKEDTEGFFGGMKIKAA